MLASSCLTVPRTVSARRSLGSDIA
jgi:hypothetical protein